MKKLINDPHFVVREMLEGLVDTYPALALLDDEHVVVRADAASARDGKVAIVSGGGSGHEPAHAGYIGAGMLSAAVVGDVFTSPSVDAVLAAIRHVGKKTGVLLIVKNYTGDRLNFGLAAELARAEGIPVEVVVVGDDVALRGKVPTERRRGIAGTVLVHKLAGAAADAGASLAATAEVARLAAAEVRSMGVGLGLCTLPAVGKAGYALADDEIELGLGIHGEKGVLRTKAVPADALVDMVLESILSDLELTTGKPVVVLVNGLGGTPAMELAIVMRRALANLRGRGLQVVRAWMGDFMTALEMPGFSLSLLPVDDDRLRLLDSPTAAPAWQRASPLREHRRMVQSVAAVEESTDVVSIGPHSLLMRHIVELVADRLLAAEESLTDLDARAGDGDLGASMARGAAAIRSLPEESFSTPDALLRAMGGAVRRAIGGSSGPFYASGLVRAGATLRGIESPDQTDWQNALAAGIQAVVELGGAKRGERTMLDALIPALEAWHGKGGSGFGAAVRAAAEGADATAEMRPQQGRASYLSERALGIPDGGAVAVSIWLSAIADGLSAGQRFDNVAPHASPSATLAPAQAETTTCRVTSS
jgi:ATP-dependent dihydroxyacetone kinase